MANKDVAPYKGSTIADVSTLAPTLVDIEDNKRQGFKREKPEFDKVEKELAVSMPAVGDQAGIHPSIYQGFLDKTKAINDIRAAKAIVDKLAEVLEDSEIYYEDGREGDIIRICEAVESANQHGQTQGLLAYFSKTLAYRSQYGEKAAAARKKNEGNKEPK